ncbi:hypothetical protein [Lyngbya confervoides]|uniref:Uncharacterized protein n=1 Tax=Lyngbya confervoides BDU141951 TaxID=1574623 RepID=A0ABD4T793_9CYAN|nr:hypothetical protein [Lyngbya confervoides]MCM1984442.1 hypothetical protein [Lyngbya confervoides BDU141951]
MATYHQLTLFDVDAYASECNTSDSVKVSRIEEFSVQVYEQLELDLFPEPPKKFFIKGLRQAA